MLPASASGTKRSLAVAAHPPPPAAPVARKSKPASRSEGAASNDLKAKLDVKKNTLLNSAARTKLDLGRQIEGLEHDANKQFCKMKQELRETWKKGDTALREVRE